MAAVAWQCCPISPSAGLHTVQRVGRRVGGREGGGGSLLANIRHVFTQIAF